VTGGESSIVDMEKGHGEGTQEKGHRRKGGGRERQER
jgi:hypothetical protein